ncbi:MAG: methyltransferase [Tagaea sp.]
MSGALGEESEAVLPASRPSLVDRLRGWYARMVVDPQFRRWAASFPLTRPIARREARAAFDLCAGFVYSQILFACVRLRVLDLLAEGAMAADEVARSADLTPERAGRLLDAAVALGLLRRDAEGRYALAARGALIGADPGIRAMIEHHAMVYRDLADTVALLRAGRAETRLNGYWGYAASPDPGALDEGRVAAYSRLMSASLPMVADEILDAYPLGRHRRVLDIGGGEGGFLIAAGRRWPGLALTLFDLPAVAARARANFTAAGLDDLAVAHGGDMRRDALPRGADVATLVRVLHDHDDDSAMAILRAARAALDPGGVLLIGEPMAEAPGAAAVGDAYFGFYLLSMGQGRARAPARLAGMLDAAGFAGVRHRPTRLPLVAGVTTAVARR